MAYYFGEDGGSAAAAADLSSRSLGHRVGAGSVARCEGDLDGPLSPEADGAILGCSRLQGGNERLLQQSLERSLNGSLMETPRSVFAESASSPKNLDGHEKSTFKTSPDRSSTCSIRAAMLSSSGDRATSRGGTVEEGLPCKAHSTSTSREATTRLAEASDTSRYNIQACGELYSLLHCREACSQSLGAQIVLNTPLLYFLSPSDLSNAAAVCKLWWAELYSPQKMQWFFALPGNQPEDNEQPRQTTSVRFKISPSRRAVIWRLALLGEFENYNGQLYDALEEYVELEDNYTKGSFLCRHAGSRSGERRVSLERVVESSVSRNAHSGHQIEPCTDPTNVNLSFDAVDDTGTRRQVYNDDTSDYDPSALTPRSINEMLNNDGLIRRDIDRTFPHRPLFSRSNPSVPGNSDDSSTAWVLGHRWLYRMLSYVALSRELGVGYCQGMNFIAGVFLETFDCNHQLATRCFNAFLQRKDISSILGPELLEAQAVCADLDNLVTFYLPALAAHFDTWNLNAVTYALQWVVTFFAYDMAVASVVLIWDQLFIGGLSVVIQVILGLLHRHEENLLGLQFEECLRYLKGITASVKLRVEDLSEFSLRFSALYPYSPRQYINMDSPGFLQLRSLEGGPFGGSPGTNQDSAAIFQRHETLDFFGRPSGEPPWTTRRSFLRGLNPADVALCCSPKALEDDCNTDVVVAFNGQYRLPGHASIWRNGRVTCHDEGKPTESNGSIATLRCAPGEFEVTVGEKEPETDGDGIEIFSNTPETPKRKPSAFSLGQPSPKALGGGLASFVFAACQDSLPADIESPQHASWERSAETGSMLCRSPRFVDSTLHSRISERAATARVSRLADWPVASLVATNASPRIGTVVCPSHGMVPEAKPRPFRVCRRSPPVVKATGSVASSPGT